jgi:hypothetical protein
MKINYGLVAVDSNDDILHFCGYEEEPTQCDIDHLREELSQDMSFGLTEMMDEIEIITASDEVLKFYQDVVGNGGEITEEEEKI